MRNLRLRSWIGFIAISALTLSVYQNCGQLGGGFDFFNSEQLSMSSDSLADTNHPAAVAASQSTQKMQIANRGYVAQLLREIFTSAAHPVPGLEGMIFNWVGKRDSQYGLGCDPYSSATGGDCGGDISAANLPITTDDNTVRQSYRVQGCDNILGTDAAVAAVLEKIQVSSLAPNASAIAQIYKLFYRGDGASEEIVNALVTMDRDLAESGETPTDRWRTVILQICLSPGWQSL